MRIGTMARKNVRRHARRTIVTAGAIAVGLTFYILLDSLMQGWANDTELAYRRYEVGSGRVVNAQWWEQRRELPLKHSIAEPRSVIEACEALSLPYTTRTEFAAELVFYRDPYPEDGSVAVRVTAIDPVRDGEVFALVEAMESPYSRGEFFSAAGGGIVVGEGVAQEFGIEVGYPIRLHFAGRLGYEEIFDTTVVGVIRSDAPHINQNGVYISMEDADSFLAMDGAVTGVSFRSSGGRSSEEAIASLQEVLPPRYRVLGYRDIAEDVLSVVDSKRGAANIMFLLIFVIAAVGISNTMMMSVFERRREIGMLRAQGMTNATLYRLYVSEAVLIALVGTVCGLAIGALVNTPLAGVGLPYGALVGSGDQAIEMGSLTIPPTIKGVWHLGAFVRGGVFAVVVSAVVALFPLRRLLHRSIPENLTR